MARPTQVNVCARYHYLFANACLGRPGPVESTELQPNHRRVYLVYAHAEKGITKHTENEHEVRDPTRSNPPFHSGLRLDLKCEAETSQFRVHSAGDRDHEISIFLPIYRNLDQYSEETALP